MNAEPFGFLRRGSMRATRIKSSTPPVLNNSQSNSPTRRFRSVVEFFLSS
jgi:hypothetical protein